jgi:diguanylate cyclase (GGDEF)-like protein/PAS domain S-box-containing protein
MEDFTRAGFEPTCAPVAATPLEGAHTAHGAQADEKITPQLRAFLESTSDCVAILDRQWRFTFLNRRAEAEIASGRQLVGVSLWEAFPEVAGTKFEEHYRRAMEAGSSARFEGYYAPLEAWYEVNVQPAEGGIALWFRNLNERKRAEQDLRVAEERYRLAARATKDLIWDIDPRTGRIHWDDGLGERFGYAADQLGTHSSWWSDRIHPDDRGRILADVDKIFAGDADQFNGEYRFLRADGSYAEVHDRGYAIRDEEGRPIRIVGAIQDNSERNRAIDALRERERQLATVFGQAMIGIFHGNLSGKALMVNDRFCEILGRSREEVLELTFADCTHPEDLEWNRPLFEAHAATGEPFQIEKRYIRGDGSTVWCAVHCSFVRDTSGNVASYIATIEDITARRAAEMALEAQKSLLQNVIDSVADLIFVKDRHGGFILTNRALDDACGSLVGRRCTDYFENDLANFYDAVDQEVIASGEPRAVDERMPVRGKDRLFQTVKVPWINNGEIAGVIGVSRDITEKKQAELQLRESEALHRSVLEASADCITILTAEGLLELMNSPGAAAMDFQDPEAVKGQPWLTWWPEEAREDVTAALTRARAGKAARFTSTCLTAKGAAKWWDVVVTPIKDETGRVNRILAIARDITASRETAERLRIASEQDALTGLPNRRSFQARLQASVAGARERGGMVGLLLLDLDHFKHVNDTLGHAAGDHLLKTLAVRLQRTLRGGDFVARLGGDEFAIILEDVEEEDELVKAGDAILGRLRAPIRYDGRLVNGGASIGGALFPRDASAAHELLKNADTALYALKAQGRGGTRMFHQHMRERAQKVASQLSLARVALAEKSIVPNYQPKVSLATGLIHGFEALLRWKHPTRGLQHPDTIVEAFREYELASKIGEMMQTAVARDIRVWQRAGVDFGHISINAAPAEFLRDDYAERLLALLGRYSVHPSLVEVEVTEHVFLDRGADFVSRALRTLKNAGIRIALDDFGTGYSSLSHLRDFPVDVVKIDRSFVGSMEGEPEIAAIVAAVIDLARSLSIEVVAEGIETEQQKELLKAHDCSFGQGFLFGAAIEACHVPHRCGGGSLGLAPAA